MRIVVCFIFLSLVGLHDVRAQKNKPKTFETLARIIWAGVDRPGDLFLVLQTGEVLKFNKAGKKIGSHGFKTPPTLLDPMDGVQSFFYSRSENAYGSLSSDLGTTTQHTLDPSFAIGPSLVCPSSLHELWILDSADFSIKKTKTNSTTISLDATLSNAQQRNVKDFLYMREYQNYLFLLDKTAGIHLFNTLGKYIKTIGEKGLTYFGFFGEEIYFLKDKDLILVDLYTNETRKLAVPVSCNFALLTDDKLYAVGADRVTILDFKP